MRMLNDQSHARIHAPPIVAQLTFADDGTPQGNAEAGIEGLRVTREFFARHLGVGE